MNMNHNSIAAKRDTMKFIECYERCGLPNDLNKRPIQSDITCIASNEKYFAKATHFMVFAVLRSDLCLACNSTEELPMHTGNDQTSDVAWMHIYLHNIHTLSDDDVAFL